MKPHILFVFLFLLLTSCKNGRGESTVFAEREKVVFSDYKMINTADFPEEKIKNTIYIKLDLDDERKNLANLDKVLFSGGKLYALDRSKKILLVFDNAGSFLGQIGNTDPGPQDIVRVTDFDVDENGRVHVLDGYMDQDRILIYSPDFGLESVSKLGFEADIIKCLGDKKIMFGLSLWNQGSYKGNMVAVMDGDEVTPYLEHDKFVDVNVFFYYTFISADGNIFYNKPIDNNLYQFDKHGVPQKTYFFDFGIFNVPEILKRNYEDNMMKLREHRYLSDFTVVYKDYILGTLNDKGFYRTFFVDKPEKTLYVGEPKPRLDYTGSFCGFDDKYIISYIYPERYAEPGFSDLPQDVIDHLKQDQPVVCLKELG
jgi:hypothetical protein